MFELSKKFEDIFVSFPNSVGMVPLYPWEPRETLVVSVGSVVGRAAPLARPGTRATIAAAVAARGSTLLAQARAPTSLRRAPT